MKLEDARSNYYFHSGKASDVVRQLGLAAVAVVWLFKKDVNGSPSIPSDLLLPLALVIIGLACDLLHYVIATSIWGVFQRRQERAGVKEDEEFLAPTALNWPGIIFFAGKVAAIAVAYVLILRYLSRIVTPY